MDTYIKPFQDLLVNKLQVTIYQYFIEHVHDIIYNINID